MDDESSEISRLERADKLGVEFVRATMILNGGAVLALLAFVGDSGGNPLLTFRLESVANSMWAFLIGITLMMFALIVSYSFTASAPETRYHQFWNNWIIRLNALCGIASLISFVVGVSSLIVGIETFS